MTRSFADPETEFCLLKGDDGEGQPTGEVQCRYCSKVSGAPEYIPHAAGCPQADVTSQYYDETH